MNDAQLLRVTRIVGAMAPEQQARLHPDARLREDLGYDSLRLIELAIALEQDLGVEIASDEIADALTLADVWGAVSRRREILT